MQNGTYETFVHGWQSFFKYEDGLFYIPDHSSKKGYYWQLTVLCPERIKTLVDITGASDNDVETLLLSQEAFSRIRRGV
jgi:hypothetical protein